MKRAMAAAVGTVLSVLAVGCGDTGVEPDDPVVGLVVADSVVLDALRDTAWLSAELVHESGRREVAETASWTGCDDQAGSISADGVFQTLAAGECVVVASWGELEASARVVVRPQGVLTITFDDGWKTARTVALPVLTEAGLVGNVAVVPGTVGWPAYLAVADMRQLHDAGWSFVSHTMTHDSLPSLTAEEMEWQMLEPVRWLREAELRTGNVFVVPYHEWGEREQAAVREHFAAARGRTVDYFWPERLVEWRPEDPYGITSIDASALARTAEGRDRAMGYVERAVTEGLLLDLQFHDIPPAEEAGFRQLVQQLAPYADRFRTWSAIYPLPGAN